MMEIKYLTGWRILESGDYEMQIMSFKINVKVYNERWTLSFACTASYKFLYCLDNMKLKIVICYQKVLLEIEQTELKYSYQN